MKSKNKFLAGIMCLAMMFSISGCTGNQAVEAVKSAAVGAVEKETEETSPVEKVKDAAKSVAEKRQPGTADVTAPPENETAEDAGFTMTMLDVGQGLSVLVEAAGEYMLYDGGDRETSSYVVSYLESHGITELQYIFTSHYDSDHIAGLVGVMESGKFQVDEVVCPDYIADSSIYRSYTQALLDCQAEVVHPSVGDEFDLGGAQIVVTGPASYDGSDENNYSVAVHIAYGDCGFMITGDAGTEEEQAMIDSGCDLTSVVLVAGHHGSSTASSSAFVHAVDPSYAFISCGEGNSYGHPSQKTLDTFADAGLSIFRSDVQGEVTCYCDGTTVWFSANPTDDWTPGTYTGSSSDESETDAEETIVVTDTGDVDYVLNTGSMKFHLPDCEAVGKMSGSNKETYTGSRDDLISHGYEPCGICNP